MISKFQSCHPIDAITQKFKISVVAQYLHPLTNFCFDVSITRVCSLQFVLESVDLIQRKPLFTDPLDALHDVDEPALRIQIPLPAKEEGMTPLRIMAILPECGMA